MQHRLQRLKHLIEIDRSRKAQGPGERRPAPRDVVAVLVGVQPDAAPRHALVAVEHHDASAVVLARHQTQQDGPIPLTTTTHARALRWPMFSRSHVSPVRKHHRRALGRDQSTSSGWGVISPSGGTSEWMSMRHPVSLAASRAFWPSLPMASESW